MEKNLERKELAALNEQFLKYLNHTLANVTSHKITPVYGRATGVSSNRSNISVRLTIPEEVQRLLDSVTSPTDIAAMAQTLGVRVQVLGNGSKPLRSWTGNFSMVGGTLAMAQVVGNASLHIEQSHGRKNHSCCEGQGTFGWNMFYPGKAAHVRSMQVAASSSQDAARAWTNGSTVMLSARVVLSNLSRNGSRLKLGLESKLVPKIELIPSRVQDVVEETWGVSNLHPPSPAPRPHMKRRSRSVIIGAPVGAGLLVFGGGMAWEWYKHNAWLQVVRENPMKYDLRLEKWALKDVYNRQEYDDGWVQIIEGDDPDLDTQYFVKWEREQGRYILGREDADKLARKYGKEIELEGNTYRQGLDDFTIEHEYDLLMDMKPLRKDGVDDLLVDKVVINPVDNYMWKDIDLITYLQDKEDGTLDLIRFEDGTLDLSRVPRLMRQFLIEDEASRFSRFSEITEELLNSVASLSECELPDPDEKQRLLSDPDPDDEQRRLHDHRRRLESDLCQELVDADDVNAALHEDQQQFESEETSLENEGQILATEETEVSTADTAFADAAADMAVEESTADLLEIGCLDEGAVDAIEFSLMVVAC